MQQHWWLRIQRAFWSMQGPKQDTDRASSCKIHSSGINSTLLSVMGLLAASPIAHCQWRRLLRRPTRHCHGTMVHMTQRMCPCNRCMQSEHILFCFAQHELSLWWQSLTSAWLAHSFFMHMHCSSQHAAERIVLRNLEPNLSQMLDMIQFWFIHSLRLSFANNSKGLHLAAQWIAKHFFSISTLFNHEDFCVQRFWKQQEACASIGPRTCGSEQVNFHWSQN